MNDYRIFGGRFRSELAFPELPPAPVDGRPDWTLSIHRNGVERGGGTFLGEDVVGGDTRVRLFRTETGVRLEYEDTGSFDIDGHAGEIVWCPGPDARVEAARMDVVGRVLAAALHVRGVASLHGSAVLLGDGAVGFLAPKGFGKSTLALALVRAGARLVTDDTIAVDPGPPVRALPGVHHLRVWSDALAALGADAAAETETNGGARGPDAAGGAEGAERVKETLRDLPSDRLATAPAPLSTLYLLLPRPPDVEVAAHRTRMLGVVAALSLLSHAKLGPMLGGEAAGELMRGSTDLVRRVPIYRLEVGRSLERVGEVVEALFGWHGAPEAAGTRNV